MNNAELIEHLVELERSMTKKVDADVEAFKEKQKRELTDYETKKVWESNGYSQALVDVRNLLKEGELDELQS
jgi:hypothetical protein